MSSSDPALNGAASGAGALPDTAAVIASIVSAAQGVAERATGAGDRFTHDSQALLAALGGGPPEQLRTATAHAAAAVTALTEAAVALGDAAAALRAFAARIT